MLREEVIADTYLDGALQKESEVMLSSDLSDNGVESMFAGLQAFTAKFPHISTQSSVLKDKALFRQAVTTQGQLFAVAIPVIKESQLLDRLRIVPYSTQVPVRRAAPMEAEDVRFVKNYAPPLRDEFNDSSGRITKS